MGTKRQDNQGGKAGVTKRNGNNDQKPTKENGNTDTIPKPKITELLLTNHNRPYLKNPEFYQIRELKAIVLHWTANLNKGANAKAHYNYHNTTQRKASAHYFVDSKEIVQILPDNEVGYHVGDRATLDKTTRKRGYAITGQEIIKGTRLTPNFFTVGIEMCVNLDGDFKETLRNTVELIRYLRSIHGANIPLVRHYDVTGKKCPKHKVHGKWKLIDKRDWELIQEMCKI